MSTTEHASTITTRAKDYRFELIEDEEGVDIGDWLPQAHYNEVGPFLVDGVELSWEDWSSRPDADVSNWARFGLVLLVQCDLGDWHSTSYSLWGLDFLGYPYCRDSGEECPQPGTYTLAELGRQDAYLGDVARDLIAQHRDEQ